MVKDSSLFQEKLSARFITIIQWIVFSLTIIALMVYPFLPERKITIIPSNETFSYLNASNAVVKRWVNQQTGHWHCEIEDNNSYNYCGINLNWLNEAYKDGRDLSNFEYIKLNLDYVGEAEQVRLFLRNFDDSYAIENDANSPQYLYTNFKTSDFTNGDITISLAEITVADWWMVQYQHPRNRALPKFDHINTFGLEVFGQNISGTHEMVLNSIEFIGPFFKEENYYLTIIIIWLLAVFFHLTFQLYVTKNYAVTITNKGKELTKSNLALKKETHKYRNLSILDALTQVPNRHGFEEYILNTLTSHYKDVSLIILDIDYFKKINDIHGHTVGDMVLKELSALLQSNIRGGDYLARWGGEEFIICCTETSAENTVNFAEKLRLLIAAHSFADEITLNVTISMGIAVRDPKESFKTWFNRADQALYQAKNTGRNKTIVN